MPCLYPLLATLMLTGMRESEGLGLLTADVSFDRGLIVVAPNQFRRLKTKRSARVIPLWPQLKEVLSEYMAARPPSTLLFPSYRTGTEGMIRDWRKALDTLVTEAGELYIMADGRRRRAEPGDVRSKCFRHGYASARLQTLDAGAPTAVFTVSRELGHSSTGMVEGVYGHLGAVRQRSDQVEFRAEAFAATLGERLRALRARAEAADCVCDSV